MRRTLQSCVLSGFLLLLQAPLARAAYSIDQLVIGPAGGEVTSGLVSLEFTLGETAVGSGSAGQISMDCGYWEGVLISTVGVEAKDQVLPLQFALRQAEPSPFEGSTRISYAVANGQEVPVFLGIYDVRGALIRTLVREPQGPGIYSVTWDGRSDGGAAHHAGVYFVSFRAGAFEQTRRIVMLK